MADMEKEEGVKGSYFIRTDYVNGYYGDHVATGLCKRGMCPAGGHGVQHLNWSTGAFGGCDAEQRVCCNWSRASYDPKTQTVCGEVGTSVRMLRDSLGTKVRLDGWRTPYLESNPRQYDALAQFGVRYDSSLAVGDTPTLLVVRQCHQDL